MRARLLPKPVAPPGHFDLAKDEKVEGGENEDKRQTRVQEHGQHEIAVVGRFKTLGVNQVLGHFIGQGNIEFKRHLRFFVPSFSIL